MRSAGFQAEMKRFKAGLGKREGVSPSLRVNFGVWIRLGGTLVVNVNI